MNKTVKIPRPKFPRNSTGPSGRVEHDDRGNAVWIRTRAGESAEPPDSSALAIVHDGHTIRQPILKLRSDEKPGRKK